MNTTSEIKRYFDARVEETYYQLDNGLRAQFGLKNDATPRTGAEIIARIQSGKFVTPATNDDYGFNSIQWRDPSVKRDADGYAVAQKALRVARQKALDQIMSDETQALSVTDTFEGWTYTAPTTTVTQ